MAVIQAYQGYFQRDGRFVPDSPSVKLPTMRRVIVNVLDDMAEKESSGFQLETEHQKKAARLRKVFDEARAVEDDVMTDADWDELANIRARTNEGMARKIEL